MFKKASVIFLLVIASGTAFAGSVPLPPMMPTDSPSAIGPIMFPVPPRKPSSKTTAKAKDGIQTVSIIGAKTEDPTDAAAPKRSLEGLVFDDTGTVMPEVTTAVRFSNMDVNRITCSTDIKDVVWSQEKPVKVKWVDKEAYIKFQPLERDTDAKLFYATDPVELFVKCGGATYQIIAVPSPMPAQTIRLTSQFADKIKTNNEIYGAMPFEKKVLALLKTVYTDTIPESFTVKKYGKVIDSYKEIALTLKRIVHVEGEGLLVKEYVIELRDGGPAKIELDEKMFLKSKLVNRPVALAIDKLTLVRGASSRLLVVELSKENSN